MNKLLSLRRRYAGSGTKGFTLIELLIVISIIVVIVVLLSATSNPLKAACLRLCTQVQLHIIQQSVRGYQTVKNLSVGDALPSSDLVTEGYITGTEKAFFDGQPFTYGTTVPPIGTFYVTTPNVQPLITDGQ